MRLDVPGDAGREGYTVYVRCADGVVRELHRGAGDCGRSWSLAARAFALYQHSDEHTEPWIVAAETGDVLATPETDPQTLV